MESGSKKIRAAGGVLDITLLLQLMAAPTAMAARILQEDEDTDTSPVRAGARHHREGVYLAIRWEPYPVVNPVFSYHALQVPWVANA